MKNRSGQASCFVMGLGPLCVRCAEHLIDNGIMEVRGVISADEAVIGWGNDRGLETLHIPHKASYASSDGTIDAFLSRSRFDYFFSIINAMPLPAAILQLPTKLAINFHDSALPKYAGIDATSWAIMRREARHAVTWHVMVRGIDEGDIVKQMEVPIEVGETAFTLNAKCLDAGLVSFKELVADIRRDAVACRRQQRGDASYYSRSKPDLPEMAIWRHGVVAWEQSAEEIEALTRALDYGPTRNALGTAKIVVDDQFYILPSISIRETASPLEPGTVVDVDDDELVVSTSTRDVLVRGLLTIEGRAVSMGKVAARHQIAIGTRLAEVSAEMVRRIKDFDRTLMWKEAYWVDAIRDYVAIPVSYLSGRLTDPADRTNATAPVCVPSSTRQRVETLVVDGGFDLPALLCSAFSSFVTMGQGGVITLWYSDDEYRRDLDGITSLVSPFALCRLTVDEGCTIVEHYDRTGHQLREVKKKRHFLFDIAYRYPQLRNGRGGAELRQCAFVFHGARGRQGDWSMRRADFELSLEVIGGAGDFSMAINVARGGAASASSLAEQFSAHLDAIVSDCAMPLVQHFDLLQFRTRTADPVGPSDCRPWTRCCRNPAASDW
ncbi:MAG: formyltransferase family protein [Acidobacteriota bacterium]